MLVIYMGRETGYSGRVYDVYRRVRRATSFMR